MTDPNSNPNPERGLGRAAITPGVLRQFTASSSTIQRAAELIAILLVFYTLPHNAHAFGVTRIFSWPTLGLLVIEGTFVVTLAHFSFGWISGKTQEYAALTNLLMTLGILIGNAIVSNALYMIADPAAEVSQGVIDFVNLYRLFALPSTPIFCAVLLAWLVSCHPNVIELGVKFNHIARMNSYIRRSELKEDEAQFLQKGADLDREAARARLSASKTAREARRFEAEAEFAFKTLESMLGARSTERDTILQSENWLRLVNAVEKRQLVTQLDEMYPGIDVSLFVDGDGELIDVAQLISEHTAASMRISELVNELGDAYAVIDDLKLDIEHLRKERLAIPLSSDSSPSDGQPAYANGAAD